MIKYIQTDVAAGAACTNVYDNIFLFELIPWRRRSSPRRRRRRLRRVAGSHPPVVVAEGLTGWRARKRYIDLRGAIRFWSCVPRRHCRRRCRRRRRRWWLHRSRRRRRRVINAYTARPSRRGAAAARRRRRVGSTATIHSLYNLYCTLSFVHTPPTLFAPP